MTKDEEDFRLKLEKDGEFDDLEDLKEFWEKKNGLIS